MEVRRVVTAQIGGHGIVVSDAAAPDIYRIGGGITVIDLWKTTATPAPLGKTANLPDGGPLTLGPALRGTTFRLTDFPPEPEQGIDAATAAEIFSTLGAGHASTATSGTPSALMHRTQTIDYGIVLEGEMTLILDEEEVVLRPGDVVIQQGANHSWSNRSGKLCRMAFVMVDAVET